MKDRTMLQKAEEALHAAQEGKQMSLQDFGPAPVHFQYWRPEVLANMSVFQLSRMVIKS